MHKGMFALSESNISFPSASAARVISNASAHRAKSLYVPEREEHIFSYFSTVLVLIVGWITLYQYQMWKHREEGLAIPVVTPTVESDDQLDENSLEDTVEIPLLKALGGHDLSQPIEYVSTRQSPHHVPACVHSNIRMIGLEAPRAKGRSEPAPRAQVNVLKGDQKALVIGLDGPVAHKDRSLHHASRDARRFSECLKELNNASQRPGSQLSGCFNFSIEMLTDGDGEYVSRTKVFKALENLFKGAKAGDLLVLFFSGHCSRKYLGGIVSMMTVEDEKSFLLVPSTVFSQHISKLPPGCTVEVFLDCCYSSGLIPLDKVIRKMTPGNVSPGTSTPVSVVSPGTHVSYGVYAPPVFNHVDSNRSKAPGTAAGILNSPLSLIRAPVGLPGSQPNGKISIDADVIVWAASDITERAYESERLEGGPLAIVSLIPFSVYWPAVLTVSQTKAVCRKIEESINKGVMIDRETLWQYVT
ncbi:unnamed protein product [Rhizoctonia solani]|uniref:Peptidase C14 caspase domain-containing protein n=1 Tax=Rhizoctonia solani TaxID=456999 RepID=A0A8H3H4M4_9AGAM|nr:unnamed protein product [Rhizoctonia solani]